MAPLFFYGRDSAQFGPFSATGMRELAAAGEILSTDSVWQQGVDRKVPASRVANLFALTAPAALKEALPSVPPRAEPRGPVTERQEITPSQEADLAATVQAIHGTRPSEKAPPAPQAPPRKKRVISIKGGVLMGQDGVTAQFKKRCADCGWEDACRSSVVIRVGSTRVTFFCRPCRKSRTVEMQGIIG